nr:competence protein CoiA family protein [Filibacter tadaridae]
MLTAQTLEGHAITLSLEMKREQLREWRRTKDFYCCQCKEQVQLKIGDINIPHFAHRKDTACVADFSEGESKEHLLGKMLLFSFFQTHSSAVQLEPFLKMVSQRPDLLVTTKISKIPIEFQCSIIPTADVISRTDGYRSIDMEPIWILQTPAKFNTLAEGVGVFHFSKFHEQFFMRKSPEELVLLTFNPQTKRFHYFSSLIHVAGKRYIGIHRSLSIHYQTFPFAEPNAPSKDELERYAALFASMRNDFLQSRILLNRRGVRDPFLRKCYELRFLPTNLPSWVGIPVPFADAFQEHDCEWQLAIVYFVRRKGIGFHQLTENLIRKLMDCQENNSERKIQACLAYRNFLLSIGINSSRENVAFNEINIFKLISDRFLAN